MTILGNLPVSPAILGKLLTENLMLHQQVKDSLHELKRKPT